MKANINHTPIRVFNSIEDYSLRFKNPYNLRPNTALYHTLASEEHYKDGWRDVVSSQFDLLTQRLGEIYFDTENDVYTYQINDISAEEIKANRMAGAMVITQLQGLLMLEQMGLSDTVENMLIANEHKASQIYFEYSPTWERSSPIIGRMANLLGMTEEQLDDLFLSASQLS